MPAREGGEAARAAEQWGARALLLMDWGFHLFQDFLLKAVRAKRERSIQVPNAQGLFGINFLNQERPNPSLTSMCTTQLPRFQSPAALLSLFSQTSTITQVLGVHTTDLSLKLNNFKKKYSLSKPLHFALKTSKQAIICGISS